MREAWVFNHCSAIIEFPFGNTQRLQETFRPLCSMFGQDIAGISIYRRIKGCEISCSGDCVTAPLPGQGSRWSICVLATRECKGLIGF